MASGVKSQPRQIELLLGEDNLSLTGPRNIRLVLVPQGLFVS